MRITRCLRLSDLLYKTSISNPRIKEEEVGLGCVWNLEDSAVAKFLDGEGHILGSLCAEITRAPQLTNAETRTPPAVQSSCLGELDSYKPHELLHPAACHEDEQAC